MQYNQHWTELTFHERVCAWIPTWSPGRIQTTAKLTNRMMDSWLLRDMEDIKEVRPQIRRAWGLVLCAGGSAGEWQSVCFDSEQDTVLRSDVT